MTYIDKIIEKKTEYESAETYIENYKSLHILPVKYQAARKACGQ